MRNYVGNFDSRGYSGNNFENTAKIFHIVSCYIAIYTILTMCLLLYTIKIITTDNTKLFFIDYVLCLCDKYA